MRQAILILFLFCCLFPAAAQRVTVSGYLIEAGSGEKLIGASVFDLRSQAGAYSNNYGFYSLSLPADSVMLVATFSGYQRLQTGLFLDRDTSLNLYLSPFALEEVEIVASQQQRNDQKTEMSTIDVPVSQIKMLPALLGEVDVIKALQLMPGVQSGNEGSSGLYVRGGGPDQNLILLDGVPLYFVSHLGGLFSVFNADAISQIKLVKGGFPARYGGRLSSVLDIRMKEGNNQTFHGDASIGLLSAKLSLQGPIRFGKEKGPAATSYIISARRTYLDIFSKPVSRKFLENKGTFAYNFHDLNFKLNHTFSDQDRVFISGYLGDDKSLAEFTDRHYDSENEQTVSEAFDTRIKWGNRVLAARWNHIWSPRLFSNLTATWSNYRFHAGVDYTETAIAVLTAEETEFSAFAAYDSDVKDLGLKLEFDYYPAPSHDIRFGAQSVRHSFLPGVSTYSFATLDTVSQDTSFGAVRTRSWESYVYVEDEWEIGNRLSLNLGLHAVHYRVETKDYFSLQPRFSARLMLAEKLSFKASYARMTQFIHLLSNSDAGLPTDLWVPATAIVPPQNAWQTAAGIAASLLKDQLELTVEAYYKQMEGLVEYAEGATFFGNTEDWQQKVVAGGKGKAWGVEFMLRKSRGPLTGWIGYTLAWNRRQFAQLNNGAAFPYRYDRRHDLSLVLIWKISPKLSLSTTWVYGTGNAVTLATGKYNSFLNDIRRPPGYPIKQPRDIHFFDGGRNNVRMRSYHRLDLGLTYSWERQKEMRNWKQSLNFSLYNAYNRHNPYFYFFTEDATQLDDNGQPGSVLKQFSLFPVVPSVSYSFSF